MNTSNFTGINNIRVFPITHTEKNGQLKGSNRNKHAFCGIIGEKALLGSPASVLTHRTSAVLSLCSCSCQLYP